LKGEVREAFPLPQDRDACEVFQSLKPSQDLVHILVRVSDGADAGDAVQGHDALQGDLGIRGFPFVHGVEASHLAELLSHQMEVRSVKVPRCQDAFPRLPGPHIRDLVVFLQVFSLDLRFHLDLEDGAVKLLSEAVIFGHSRKKVGVLI
jgi:hypothetical protein